MPNSLRSSIQALATSFASSVMNSIRGASLQELLSESGGGRPSARSAAPKRARASASGRLKRRSAADIATALNQVVTLVKGHKDGLRAEQIRERLGVQAKEMPRILSEGLSKKKLKKKGQKRATTYFAK
jgi:Fic family protein